ncbi:MAG TPA: DUF3089 domain-containing protein [Candidatus Acidoferrales bacterium]
MTKPRLFSRSIFSGLHLQRIIFTLLGLLIFAATTEAQTPGAPAAAASAGTSAKNDYSDPATWLCLPGRQDSCAVDLSSTVIAADGAMTIEKFTPNPDAPIDCFYVYPTVSLEPRPNSDMTLGPAEKRVVAAQFARFASQCRLYAPMYRQVTIFGLRQALLGGATPETEQAERALAYNDVLDAWNYYLQHDNHGRAVVIFGHSQGANILMHLIQNEIDGKPVQSRLVSALLLGFNFAVPKGQDVGGVFQKIPLCRAASQTGCVITYVSFRATSPPPENTRFGRVAIEGMVAGCTNPAALGGGSGELHAYLPAGSRNATTGAFSGDEHPWVTPPKPVETPFVSLPGMLSAECESNEHGSYLAVTVHDDPADARAHDITGDLVIDGYVLKDWGLHLIDVNEALGNLVDIVGQQSKAYRAAASKK